MSATITPRTKLSKQIRLLFGAGMVDVDLDQDHIDLAIDIAIERYRQRSDGSMTEQGLFLTLQTDQDTYQLPDNIQEIWKIHRHTVGFQVGSGGLNFDPANASFSNYFLQQAGQSGGGLTTWELFGEYKETLSRIFASEINFTWNPDSHVLTILRRPAGIETVLVSAWAQKTEDNIISGVYSGPWIRDFAHAYCKFMLGEARSKFSSGIPGPQGSVMMNGSELKAEAKEAMERLETELQNYTTSDKGGVFIIG